MARTWLSIRVDLVEGHGEHLRPRPGPDLRRGSRPTFAQLADAIDDALARRDHSRLQEFILHDSTRISLPDAAWGGWDEPGAVLDRRRARLSRLRPGEPFVDVFDLRNDWATTAVER